MAQTMTLAHAEVAGTTIMDDADIEAWAPGTRILLRLVRALIAGARAEPGLNAWYDSKTIGRHVIRKIDLGLAVDTPDGLFVPVLRNVDTMPPEELESGLRRLIADTQARRVPPEDLRGNTITLSNYGTIAGRYASPVVVPPKSRTAPGSGAAGWIRNSSTCRSRLPSKSIATCTAPRPRSAAARRHQPLTRSRASTSATSAQDIISARAWRPTSTKVLPPATWTVQVWAAPV